jgi:hypothetical protein
MSLYSPCRYKYKMKNLLPVLFLLTLLSTSCATTPTVKQAPPGTYTGMCDYQGNVYAFQEAKVWLTTDNVLHVKVDGAHEYEFEGKDAACHFVRDDLPQGDLVSSAVMVPDRPNKQQLLILIGCDPLYGTCTA